MCLFQFGVGGSLDSDVIYTKDSFLPRRVGLNFTFDLNDKSFNVFEIGGEFQHMEKYLSRLFGKDGYFGQERLKKIIENLKPKDSKEDAKINEFQDKYEVSLKENENKKKMKTSTNETMDSEPTPEAADTTGKLDEEKDAEELFGRDEKEGKAAMFVRLFGKEVMYIDNILEKDPIEFLKKMRKEISTPKSTQVRDKVLITNNMTVGLLKN